MIATSTITPRFSRPRTPFPRSTARTTGETREWTNPVQKATRRAAWARRRSARRDRHDRTQRFGLTGAVLMLLLALMVGAASNPLARADAIQKAERLEQTVPSASPSATYAHTRTPASSAHGS